MNAPINTASARRRFAETPRHPTEVVNDVLRTGLADTFEDYARQALSSGDRQAHGIWMTAAALARGYTPR